MRDGNGGAPPAPAPEGLVEQVVQRVEISPIQTILSGCTWRVDPQPDGGKAIVLIHPTGSMVYVIPLPRDSARDMAGALAGGLEIVNASLADAG